MMDESREMHSSNDLESVIAGENPMLVSFVPKAKSNEFVKVKSYGIFAKIYLCIFITALMSPLVVCDLYFALTDSSCINQTFNSLQINMKDYLFVTGIIDAIIICIIDLLILLVEYNFDKKSNKDDTFAILSIGVWIFKLFSISWLVLGCTIFWYFMDTTKCSKPTYSYLLARFILYIVSTVLTVLKN
jgi:hypothetical protein